ncbi:MAG: hypothetical protein KDK70_28875 [Myxococcales bacterium]|nr:hypothetical protein [Myxococcales bacterium]
MSTESPYDIFLGTWSGTCSSFDRNGALIANWVFTVEYAWLNEEKTKFYFEQYIDPFFVHEDHRGWFDDDAIVLAKSGAQALEKYEEAHAKFLKDNKLIKVVSVLDVSGKDGKRVEGWARESEAGQQHWYHITGGESSCGIFLLMLRYPYGGVTYCNNTYFPNLNLRQTIGPTLADSKDLGGHCQITKGLVQTNNSQTYSRISNTAPSMDTARKKKEFLDQWEKALRKKEEEEKEEFV